MNLQQSLSNILGFSVFYSSFFYLSFLQPIVTAVFRDPHRGHFNDFDNVQLLQRLSLRFIVLAVSHDQARETRCTPSKSGE
jgi:hypothetical protein